MAVPTTALLRTSARFVSSDRPAGELDDPAQQVGRDVLAVDAGCVAVGERLLDDGVDLLVRPSRPGRERGSRSTPHCPGPAPTVAAISAAASSGVSTRIGTATPLEREKNDGNSSVP